MATRNKEFIRSFVSDNQYRMDLPNQYYGDEPNTYRKDFDAARVRAIMMASWAYEAAAGNQSIPAVYKSINEGLNPRGEKPFMCDRWYLPATARDLKMFEKAEVPCFGIEAKRQIMDYDVVMTSIAYPILTLSFWKYLSMSSIPGRRQYRMDQGREKFPMIMVGGQAYGAPEVLAPIIDCFWLGEVEDEPGNPGIAAVFSRIEQFKATGLWSIDRTACYQALAREFNFLYFPEFVDVEYEYQDRSHVGVGVVEDLDSGEVKGLAEDGSVRLSKQVKNYTSNLEGMRLPFLKRIVKDFDAIAPLDNPPLLYSDPGMGAGDLEVGRGCPAWCSFCALTYRQKPYRQRTVPYMTEFAKNFQANMGSTNLVPFSPDFPMHTQRNSLIKSLLENVSDEVDAGAMRVDDFIADGDFILLQVHGGLDGVTLGVEGNSQRMRDLVGKGTADEDIKEAVARGIRAGIRKFKFFMIGNLPGEDEGDVFRILKLAKELADIRENMGQPQVRLQFSWTPLLIEANTPFQWFAPPTTTRALGDVWEEFRELKVDFKLGGKAEVNKATFFQLCQRASREVGEALVDTLEHFNQGCWGGVPKTMKAVLEEKLRDRGFHNDLDDCFDERFKNDMFGWEFIDQGVSTELLWVTYLQMREFVEQTDSHTYDQAFGDDYHGNEWIERCDTRCYGKTCGTCDAKDLTKRRQYIIESQHDYKVDLSNVKPVNQKSVAFKVRARLSKPDTYRFIQNDHWRFNLRRAAFRVTNKHDLPYVMSKRSLRFASDDIRYRDWTSGVDYVEFGMTKRMTKKEVQFYIDEMNKELMVDGSDTPWISIGEWIVFPADTPNMRTDVDLSVWDLELDMEPLKLLEHIRVWNESDYIKMTLKQEGGYFQLPTREVNAKDYAKDLWVVRDGRKVVLRMLLRGEPSPYNVYASLTNRVSWITAAKQPARRVDSFVEMDEGQADFFRNSCEDCGLTIPTNILDQPYDLTYCVHCRDRHNGSEIGGAKELAAV